MNGLFKIKPELLNSIKSTTINHNTSTNTPKFINSFIGLNNAQSSLSSKNIIVSSPITAVAFSNTSSNSNSTNSSNNDSNDNNYSKRYFSNEIPPAPPTTRSVNNSINETYRPVQFRKYPTPELFKGFAKQLVDPLTGEIDFLKFKEKVDQITNNETVFDKLEFLYVWATKVMKTKSIIILEVFLYQFRKIKSSTFLKVLEYINQNDITQNIFTFNISLYYYAENSMFDQARQLTDLLLSMGSKLPEKAFLAMINVFSSDYPMLKRIDALIKKGFVVDDKTRLLNELFVVFIESHRDLESALLLLEIIESEQLQVFFSSMVSLLQFFANNNMTSQAVLLLDNIGLKYPTWYTSKKFVDRIAPIIVSLHVNLPEIIEQAVRNDYDSQFFYNTLISSFSTSRNINAVVLLYNQMIKKFAPSPVTIKTLLLLSVKEDNYDQCIYWIGVLKGLGFFLDSKLYIRLIRFFIKHKKFEMIEELIKDYKDNADLWTPMSTGYIIYYLCYISTNKELSQEANPIISSLDQLSIEYREQVTDQIIQLCLLDDRYSHAETWFNSKQTKYGISPGIDSYLNFISYHRVRNEYREASNWIKKMKAEINKDISDSNDSIFDIFYKNYQPTSSHVSKATYKEMSLHRTKILEMIPSHPDEALKLMISLINRRDTNIDEEFFIASMIRFSNNNRIMEAKAVYESVLTSGYIPSFQYTFTFLSNYYKKTQYSRYFEYISNPPPGAFKKDFEKAHICNLASYSLRKCLKTLDEQKEYYRYTDSKEFLNGLLRNLINMNQQEIVDQLVLSMFEKCEKLKWTFDIDVLESYLHKSIQNQHHIPHINRLLNFLQSQHIRFNISLIKASMASNLLLEGRVQESYKLYQSVLESDRCNYEIYDLGIRIYSKIFPIPPLENLSKWDELMYLFNSKYRVNISNLYAQYFKSLINIGRSDLVAKEIVKSSFYYKHLPYEAIPLMCKALRDKPDKLLKLVSVLKQKGHTIKDKEALKLIKDAHEALPHVNPKDIKDIFKRVQSLNYVEDFKFTPEELKQLDQIINLKQKQVIINQSNNINNNNNNNSDKSLMEDIGNYNNNNNNNNNNNGDQFNYNGNYSNINEKDILIV